jgi:poly(3-hydroxybutyrate) depolymerase
MRRIFFATVFLSGFVHAMTDEEALKACFSVASNDAKAAASQLTNSTWNHKEQSAKSIEQAWQAYKASAVAQGWEKEFAAMPKTLEDVIAMPADQRPKLTPSKLEADGKVMPYVLLAKGKKPEKGWPLIIALHGGGGTAEKLENPHAWPVNTREWQAQFSLFERVYPSDALYFIPRMADDNEGRWYYDYCQKMYDAAIRRAILFRDVDPDRIYVTGISEGGYTAFRLPANQPGRFAAASAMAAAEPLENAPPENLRNMAFRCDIGEQDTMFDRIGLARRFFEKLDAYQKNDPASYVHHFEPQANRGHGIDYSGGPAWMVKHVRDARPKKLVWTVQAMHHTVNLRNAWLVLDEAPATEMLPLSIMAAIDGNTVTITVKNKQGNEVDDAALRVFLDDQLLDLDQAVTVMVNSKQMYQQKVSRNLGAVAHSISLSGDPRYAFPVEISLRKK